VNGL
jgi:hypothetical protein